MTGRLRQLSEPRLRQQDGIEKYQTPVERDILVQWVRNWYTSNIVKGRQKQNQSLKLYPFTLNGKWLEGLTFCYNLYTDSRQRSGCQGYTLHCLKSISYGILHDLILSVHKRYIYAIHLYVFLQDGSRFLGLFGKEKLCLITEEIQ